MLLIRVHRSIVPNEYVNASELKSFVPAKVFSVGNPLHSMYTDQVIRILVDLNRHTRSSRFHAVDLTKSGGGSLALESSVL